MRSIFFVISVVVSFLAYSSSSYAGVWRLVMGGSCVSGSDLGGSDSQLTPENFLSSLKHDAETNGQIGKGNIEEINSTTGKVAKVTFSTGGETVKNIVMVSNAKTCAKFITYCTKNKYSTPRDCFSAIFYHTNENKNGNNEPTTTAGMNSEIGSDVKTVDEKLNAVYSKLLNEMPPEFRQKLIKSEQDWIKYRDSSVAITAWQEAGGTAQEINQNSEYLTLEKDRLKFLKSLLNQQ